MSFCKCNKCGSYLGLKYAIKKSIKTVGVDICGHLLGLPIRGKSKLVCLKNEKHKTGFIWNTSSNKAEYIHKNGEVR